MTEAVTVLTEGLIVSHREAEIIRITFQDKEKGA